MNKLSLLRGGLAILLLASGVQCSQVQPAGSLGYALDGETRLRPTPQNYNAVPPRREDATPTPVQWGMKF